MASSTKDKVVTVKRDGINVDIDLAYMRSWEGLVVAADMQSSRLDDGAKFLATVEYYRTACPNIDEVNAALKAATKDEVTAADVIAFVAECVKEATPKN